MTVDRARDILNAVSLGRGTGHVYTDAEAGALLGLAQALAPAHVAASRPVPAAAPPPTPLRLVVLGRAA